MSIKIENEKIVYECGICGVSGIKLWREYNTFLDSQTLYCAECAGKDQDMDVSQINAAGKIPSRAQPMVLTDQIGMLIPAATTAEGNTFWGYTSVPDDRCKWWRELPTKTTKGP